MFPRSRANNGDLTRRLAMSFRGRSLARLAPLLLVGAALLLGALPSHAQQDLPTITHSAPATSAGGANVTVTVAFTLPPGFQLDYPQVRVLDEQGKLLELLGTFFGPSPGTGSIKLNSANYRPGTYQVRAELHYHDAAGKSGTA